MLGGLQSEAAWCRHICNQSNIKVIDVDYRMGPEHKFPTAIYDCWDAVKWVRRSYFPLCVLYRSFLTSITGYQECAGPEH